MSKAVAILVIVTIFLSCLAVVQANATETEKEEKPMITGVQFPSEEEEQNYLSNLSEEELLRKQQKEEQSAEIIRQKKNADSIAAVNATKISLPGTFTMYRQENNYYCVPACVKSVLQYLNGRSDSQTRIANDLGTTANYGTDSTKIAPYLNKKQSFGYDRKAYPSQTSMCNNLYSTVASLKKPALMGIVNPTGNNWSYATNGHCLVINAIYSDMSKIQFADPLGGYRSGYATFYLKTAGVAYSVCREIIW